MRWQSQFLPVFLQREGETRKSCPHPSPVAAPGQLPRPDSTPESYSVSSAGGFHRIKPLPQKVSPPHLFNCFGSFFVAPPKIGRLDQRNTLRAASLSHLLRKHHLFVSSFAYWNPVISASPSSSRTVHAGSLFILVMERQLKSEFPLERRWSV